MPTRKLFYEDSYMRQFQSVVTECREGKQGFEICLQETAFYPEGGGQPFDTGRLISLEGNAEESEKAVQGNTASVLVREVHEKDGVIWHRTDAPLPAGTPVRGEIDWERRFDHMQQHSGEHIVSGMICFSRGCDNIGFHLGSGVVEIDFNTELSPEDVRELELRANRYVWENHEMEITWPSPEELKALPYRSKKELEGEVRITRWPGADLCACCGTHVRRSGEIGQILLLSSMRMKGGTRIEMVCGGRALAYLNAVKAENDRISHLLSAKWDETSAAVEKLQQEAISLKVQRNETEQSHIREVAEAARGAGNILRFETSLTPDNHRKMANDLMEVCGGRAAVFVGDDETGYRYVIGEKGGDLRAFTKELNAALSGRGGGKPFFVQGSVTAGRSEIEAFMMKAE